MLINDPILRKTITYRIAITIVVFLYMIIHLSLTEDMSWRHIITQSTGMSIGSMLVSMTFYYFFELWWAGELKLKIKNQKIE